MKTIYIVRHAKSSWVYENIEDAYRPLKKRGIKDAQLMAAFLKEHITRPDIFLTSYATRALSTAVIFAETMNFPLSHLSIKKSLYDFSSGYFLKTIRALDDNFNNCILFGHDHVITDFVNKHGSEKIKHIPTCGIVGISFENRHWKNIKKGNTILKTFPKHHKEKKQ